LRIQADARRTRHPVAALLSGAALVLACLVVPDVRPLGPFALATIVMVALVFTRPPVSFALRLFAAMALVYVPMLLFLPPHAAGRGAATSMVAVLAIGFMGRAALHDAINSLPLPQMPKLLLMQILHQTSVLFGETGRIRTALTVRGAGGVRVLAALPRVWLPRVIFKAERVANALDMRGYGKQLPPVVPRRWNRADVVYATASLALLLGALCLRWTA
jgi:hypothetical protein